MINADGTITYTPAANYAGADSFTYTISDGQGGNGDGDRQRHCDRGQRRPVAADDAAATAEDTSVNIAVLANDTDIDGDSLTVSGGHAAGPRQRGGQCGRHDQLHAGRELHGRGQLQLHDRATARAAAPRRR